MFRRPLFRRAIWALGTLLVLSLATYALLRAAPGNPFEAAEAAGRLEDDARLFETHGWEKSWWGGYAAWLQGLARGDLGHSFVDARPVMGSIRQALGPTLLVSAAALLLALGAGVPTGMLVAWRRRRFEQSALEQLCAAVSSVPLFVLGVLLLDAFTGRGALAWFPVAGWRSDVAVSASVFDVAWHLVLPVCCLAVPWWAWVSRFVLASTRESLDAPWMRTARSKGLSDGVVLRRHLLRPSLAPLVSALGLALPQLLGGSVVIERLFGLPGMGELGLRALSLRDYPVVMGVTWTLGVAAVGGMFAADVVGAHLDPRVRIDGGIR